MFKKLNLNHKLQLKKFWQEESAQGMTEYILLIVIVVALAYLFKDKIKSAVGAKTEQVGQDITNFSAQ